MLKELDPLLHSQLRLAVMSILLSVDRQPNIFGSGKNLSVRKQGHRAK